MIVNIIIYNSYYIMAEGCKLPQTRTRCNPIIAAAQHIGAAYRIKCHERHFKMLHIHKSGSNIHSVGLAMHIDYSDVLQDARQLDPMKHSWDRRTIAAWRLTWPPL